MNHHSYVDVDGPIRMTTMSQNPTYMLVTRSVDMYRCWVLAPGTYGPNSRPGRYCSGHRHIDMPVGKRAGAAAMDAWTLLNTNT